ncbi:hypothetical protein FZEAL_5870 [Fusarium zealandicum]|uniref:Ubiquitin-like protease family profile domain-containing protein n=1 Tax=Fusarium zealandicum TaxID=1053134 RepID=A0A8H4UIY0_9HYPO|nr:hypothetical protein FZEAL_5870 [Fusarium zealandicum]
MSAPNKLPAKVTKYNKVFVPVKGTCHWSLAVVYRKEVIAVEYYNNMMNPVYSGSVKQAFDRVSRDSKDQKMFEFKDIITMCGAEGLWNCGVFVLSVIDLLAGGNKVSDVIDLAQERTKWLDRVPSSVAGQGRHEKLLRIRLQLAWYQEALNCLKKREKLRDLLQIMGPQMEELGGQLAEESLWTGFESECLTNLLSAHREVEEDLSDLHSIHGDTKAELEEQMEAPSHQLPKLKGYSRPGCKGRSSKGSYN